MRVLILTPDIYTRGGIARYTATLAAALGELVGAQNVDVQPLLRLAGTEGNFSGYQVYDPVTTRLTLASKFRFAGRSLALGARKYGLTVCTHIGLSPVAAMIRTMYRTPFWVTCHGREAWPRFAWDVRWAIRRADLILPISRFTAETVSRVNGIPESRMRVLYNAIPDDFVERLTAGNGSQERAGDARGREKRILSVGTIYKANTYKGFDTVIEALPQVLQSVPNVRYVVAGRGDDLDRLSALARRMNVQDHVEFTGGIDDDELAAHYRECDLFVLPSRTVPDSGSGWQGEGFGRVYVEAALAAKPVVGSLGGGAVEAVLHEKTGLLVDPKSAPAVAEALLRLLQNPEEAAKMGQAGQQWALKHFTASALVENLARLLGPYAASVGEVQTCCNLRGETS
jgi:phosphatidyl-myo-inositol dimannoside synthase